MQSGHCHPCFGSAAQALAKVLKGAKEVPTADGRKGILLRPVVGQLAALVEVGRSKQQDQNMSNTLFSRMEKADPDSVAKIEGRRPVFFDRTGQSLIDAHRERKGHPLNWLLPLQSKE
jgi:hypothetical protein